MTQHSEPVGAGSSDPGGRSDPGGPSDPPRPPGPRRRALLPASTPRRVRRLVATVAVIVLSGGVAVACTTASDSTAAMAGPGDYGAVAAAPPAGSAAAGTSAAGGADSREDSSAAPESDDSSSGSDSEKSAGAAKPAQGGTGSDGKQQTEPVAALEGRQIIRTGSFAIAITVPKTKDAAADKAAVREDVSALAVKVRAAATGLGGYVSASEGDGATQSITLRIPVAQYDAARARLGALGEMTGSENSEDVTAALADMDGRIATMRAGVDRIRTLLSRAEKVGDVIAIESELSEREADLEALLRKRASAGDQVALSTITLVVSGTVAGAVATPKSEVQITPLHLGAPPDTGFLAGVMGGFDVLRDLVRGTAVFVGAVLPFLPVLLVLALIALWWRRRVTAPVAERLS